MFPSNFSELPPALFVTDKIKSDENFGKKETQEFKDLPLAARIKHVLYQEEIKFEDQSQDQSPSSETNSEMNSSERTIPYINSFYDEFDDPINEEDYSTQIKLEEPSEEIDLGLNCPERKCSNNNSLNDEIENSNEESFNNSGFDSSDLDMLEIKCEIDYSTNQIDPHTITHVFSCPSQLSSSETISNEATSSDVNSCDDENDLTSFANKCSDLSESKYEIDYSTNQIDPHEITHVFVCPMCQKKFVSLCDTRQHLSKVTRDNKGCL